MISGIAFDRPDSLSHLRAFPDHFKIYTMLPIVRIELNSIQAIDRGPVSLIQVICDRLGSVFISYCPDRLNIIWGIWDNHSTAKMCQWQCYHGQT